MTNSRNPKSRKQVLRTCLKEVSTQQIGKSAELLTLADNASRILMKILWAARLCRPDLLKSIADLTKRLTTWSIADDNSLHRLMGYIKGSTQSRLVGNVGDSMDSLYVWTQMLITVLELIILSQLVE